MKEKIFKLLKERGVTQYRLAKDIGVSAGNITDWKVGKSVPTADAISKIAQYFNVSTDYLLGLADSPVALNTVINFGRLDDVQKDRLNGFIGECLNEKGIKPIETVDVPPKKKQII